MKVVSRKAEFEVYSASDYNYIALGNECTWGWCVN